MNICQLEYLAEAIRLGNYTKTAREMFVTPQAVSRAVKLLESELNVSLFENQGRNVSPTKCALELYPYIEATLQGIAELRTLAGSFHEGGDASGLLSIAIASASCRGLYFDHSAIMRFAKMNPQITVEENHYSNESSLAAADEGLVSIAIAVEQFADARKHSDICLGHLKPRLALSSTNSLASHDSISLNDITGCRIAQPVDIKTCYATLVSRFDLSKMRRPNFDVIDPSLNEHIKFIQDGGLIFVGSCSPLIRKEYGITVRPLSQEDTFTLPVFLRFGSKSISAAAANLATFLRHQSKGR